MPQLLALVLFGAAAVAGYKSFQRAIGRATGSAANDQKHAETAEQSPMKDLGALELDPQTGVYKPRD